MIGLPAWAIWTIAAAAFLSPVLAFMMAIAVEILIDVLIEADAPASLALIGVGLIGWLLSRKHRVHPYRGAAVET
jgi:hypothetical protein